MWPATHLPLLHTLEGGHQLARLVSMITKSVRGFSQSAGSLWCNSSSGVVTLIRQPDGVRADF